MKCGWCRVPGHFQNKCPLKSAGQAKVKKQSRGDASTSGVQEDPIQEPAPQQAAADQPEPLAQEDPIQEDHNEEENACDSVITQELPVGQGMVNANDVDIEFIETEDRRGRARGGRRGRARGATRGGGRGRAWGARGVGRGRARGGRGAARGAARGRRLVDEDDDPFDIDMTLPNATDDDNSDEGGVDDPEPVVQDDPAAVVQDDPAPVLQDDGPFDIDMTLANKEDVNANDHDDIEITAVNVVNDVDAQEARREARHAKYATRRKAALKASSSGGAFKKPRKN